MSRYSSTMYIFPRLIIIIVMNDFERYHYFFYLILETKVTSHCATSSVAYSEETQTPIPLSVRPPR